MVRKFRLKKILVPMDFSRQSFNALDTAITIGQQQEASITLIQVIENVAISVVSGSEILGETPSRFSRVVNENLNVLCKSLVSKYDFRIEYAVEHGIPARAICEYAKENNFDLVVIGTKGLFGFWQRFTETIAFKVVRESPCPVLSVPGSRMFTRLKKIIFPVTSAPRMLDKYEVIRPILDTNDASLILAGLTKVNDAQSFKKVSIAMDVLKDKLRYDHIRYSSRVHFCDSISTRLLEISNNENPDLMVIIATIDHSFKRFFLGYYAKSIVCHANCPVLSIRPDMEMLN